MSEETTVFISRSGADAAFASEIGRVLEGAGYVVTLQQWDFVNRNFIDRMHATLASGARVVALLSPEYLRSDHCAAEWQNAIADDPLNKNGRLIMLRVVECEPPGLLAGLAYWDLVPIRDNRALWEEVVLDAVGADRGGGGPAVGPYWRTPGTILDTEAIRRVPSFTGREEELAAIDATLKGAIGLAVVHGLAGAGKSSMAREYAWRNREQYAVVWWLNAETEDAIIDGMLRLGSLFVRGLDQLRDRRAAAQQVTGSVLNGFAKPVLFIFDNLEDERLLRAWTPQTAAKALATSRDAFWSADIAAIALNPWPLEDASAYLRLQSERTDLTEKVAGAIADALGALPLAVAHAAAYLRGTRMVTPQRYLDHITEHLANLPRNAEYPHSVFATFTEAIAAAEREAPGAAAMLCLAAWFAPDAIPDELLRQATGSAAAELQPVLHDGTSGLGFPAALENENSIDAALGALDRLSLAAFTETSRTYAIHRLVQLAARSLVGDATRAWVECAVATVESAFPSGDFETWQQCEQLLPHALAALAALCDDVLFLPAADLAHRCSIYLRARGGYAEAESLAARDVAIREQALGAEHPDIANSMITLADVYFHQGQYAKAELAHARGLSIKEKALGPDHVHVANSLNDLAGVYERQGRYGESEAALARSLAIRERALGPEHPDVAESLNNLAAIYEHQGCYGDAETVLARSLAIKEKTLGREHPHVAHGLVSLGSIYTRQGRYGEAEALHARGLAIWEKALGPEHPYIAEGLCQLAMTYEGQGRYDEAETLHTRALAIREKALGPEHPDVAESLRGLADMCAVRERNDEAAQFYARALAICQKTLRPEHPDVMAIREKLVAVATRTGL